MNYIFFDDHTWKDLLPLTFTRPVSEIRIGILTIREKWELLIEKKTSWKTQDYLSEKFPIQFNGSNNIWISGKVDRKSTRLNSSHSQQSRMPSSA